MLQKKPILILFICILVLGMLFRIANLSPFNIYPDAYQSLIVAQNIMDYHQVVGYLGTNGMIYPDFFSWTHPIYPILINLVTFFVHNATIAGRLIAFFASILAIPLAFFYIKTIFKSQIYGLAAAFFVAFSFNHTIWSGFLMTETTGICMMLLFLISFFTEDTKQKFSNSHAIISGVLFAFTILTRYEYAVILVPLTLYGISIGKQFFRLITIFIACGVTLSFFIWQFFPLPETFTVISDQFGSLLEKEGLLFFVFFIVFLSFFFLHSSLQVKLIKFGSLFLIGFLWLLNGYVLLQWFIGPSLWFLYTDFSALRNFLIHDELLNIFALIGFPLLLKNIRRRSIGIFTFFSLFFLFAMYHRTNPAMERYMTHIIPFLLIPASYGFIETFKIIDSKKRIKKYFFLAILFLVICSQAIITFSGMKYSQDTSWYRISYEDRTTNLVKKYLPKNKTVLLITSYPEPYYYALHISTQSIADYPPYLFMDGVKENQDVFIIEDMGMHGDFPHFTLFLQKNLSKDKITSFWVHEKFHYIADVQKETYPVILYQTTLKELKAKIKNQTE